MSKKNQHIETGKLGEALALAYITDKGYITLALNWRYKHCEVDLIASMGTTLHFFEVKTRNGHQLTSPEASVTTKKMNKLKEAAQEYLFQHPEWRFLQFNVLAITLNGAAAADIFFIEDVY